MENRRAKPLIAIRAIWDWESISKYPDTVRIPMDDGNVVTYRLDVQQPHPAFLTAMEQIKAMPKGSYPQKNAPGSDG